MFHMRSFLHATLPTLFHDQSTRLFYALSKSWFFYFKFSITKYSRSSGWHWEFGMAITFCWELQMQTRDQGPVALDKTYQLNLFLTVLTISLPFKIELPKEGVLLPILCIPMTKMTWPCAYKACTLHNVNSRLLILLIHIHVAITSIIHPCWTENKLQFWKNHLELGLLAPTRE